MMKPWFRAPFDSDTPFVPSSLRAVWAYCLALLFVWILLQYARQVFRSDLRAVPGPVAARWTGLYRPWALWDGKAIDFYRQLHRQYGPIVRTAPNIVSLSDPQYISTIYSIGAKFYKGPFYSVFDVWYRGRTSAGVFSARDPVIHQALRRPLAPRYSMSSMKAMEPLTDECTEIFMSSMTDLEGQAINLGEWLQWYAFDVISAITFRRRMGFMERREDVENMIQDISACFEFAALLGQIPLSPLHLLLKARTWMAHYVPFLEPQNQLRSVVKVIEECISEYDASPRANERPDLLGWLRQSNAKGNVIPYENLVNQLSNNFLAGSDTTAISLRAVFYYLTCNPPCYVKAQREVDEAARSGKLSEYITYAESLQLPYLQAVMKEAMRCLPGVSFPLERVVPPGGAEICGVHLSAGTIVGMNPAVVHQDKSIFGEDAADFNPDRWLDVDQERVKMMDRHLLTFGYGSRVCLGKNISLMEMGKLIPQILRSFDLEWAASERSWTVSTFWFARQEGLIYRLRLRDGTSRWRDGECNDDGRTDV